MSLKLKTMTLHVVIAGCMSMAFYAQADVKIGVAGPFTGPNATYGAQYWKGASPGGGRYQCRRRHQRRKDCAGAGG